MPTMQTKSELIESLPDDPSEIEGSKATLLFIGQAWIDGYAREVDNSRYRFDVELGVLYNQGQWGGIHGTGIGHHVEDELRYHENAPEPVSKWQGPFTIELESWEQQ